jgi:Spy/CpxP family protein refolding chaperone
MRDVPRYPDVMKIVVALLSIVLTGLSVSDGLAQGSSRTATDRGDPVDLLLEIRQELNLSRDQVNALRNIQERLERSNRPHVELLLEIQREVRTHTGNSASFTGRDASRASEEQMERGRAALRRINENNLRAMESIAEVLTDSQKAATARILRLDRRRSGPWQEWRFPG